MARYVGYKIGKVHESHTVSDYYCGRCGYPVTEHDSYCPECGGAFRECDADSLEEENLQMSDLMVEMYKFIHDVCELHPYVLTNAHIPEWQITDHSTPAERYAEKMRELGIEVDE